MALEGSMAFPDGRLFAKCRRFRGFDIEQRRVPQSMLNVD